MGSVVLYFPREQRRGQGPSPPGLRPTVALLRRAGVNPLKREVTSSSDSGNRVFHKHRSNLGGGGSLQSSHSQLSYICSLAFVLSGWEAPGDRQTPFSQWPPRATP